jgi:hypothetical protein
VCDGAGFEAAEIRYRTHFEWQECEVASDEPAESEEEMLNDTPFLAISEIFPVKAFFG